MLQSTIIQWSKILSIYLYSLFIRKEVHNHAGFNDADNNNQEKKYSLSEDERNACYLLRGLGLYL